MYVLPCCLLLCLEEDLGAVKFSGQQCLEDSDVLLRMCFIVLSADLLERGKSKKKKTNTVKLEEPKDVEKDEHGFACVCTNNDLCIFKCCLLMSCVFTVV